MIEFFLPLRSLPLPLPILGKGRGMNSNWFLLHLIPFLLTGCSIAEQIRLTSPSKTRMDFPAQLTDTLSISSASKPAHTAADTYTVNPTEESSAEILSEIIAALSEDDSRNFLVLVHPRLWSGLAEELAVLEADIRNENWAPVVSRLPADSPEDLRQALQSIYSQKRFAGIFLIGDFPYTRMWGYAIENPDQPGATDYFYMDLDGEWLDANGDGFYDLHSDGQGDRQPEVFVGRLNAGNVYTLNQSELEMMKSYLHRDHAYRTGGSATSNAALYSTYAHTLYGWVGAENAEWTKVEILQSIQVLFPDTYAFIFDETVDPEDSGKWTAEFWKADDPNRKSVAPARERFQEIMGEGYDYLSIGIHGTPEAWGPEFFTNLDVKTAYDSKRQLPVFIFSASCSTGNISTPDSMGSILTMAGSLVFVGFSAPSEMRWKEFVSWNQSLAGSPVGTAFMEVQEEATPGGSGAVTRNVNWILLGDPTLKMRTGE